MRIKYAIKWGLIFVGVLWLWMLFEKAMGWHGPKIEFHSLFTKLFSILAVAIYVLAFLDKRKKVQGPMRWKHGFLFGLGITLVVTILNPLSLWIDGYVISPEYYTNAIHSAVASGRLNQEEAESYFSLKNFIIQGTFSGLIMGVITAAVVALFIQKKTPEILG